MQRNESRKIAVRADTDRSYTRGSSQVLSRQAAAVAAGQPPELTATNLAYWCAHGELADLSDLVNQFRMRAGGMYPIALDSQRAPDGGLMGAPFAIDVWPAPWGSSSPRPGP